VIFVKTQSSVRSAIRTWARESDESTSLICKCLQVTVVSQSECLFVG